MRKILLKNNKNMMDSKYYKKPIKKPYKTRKNCLRI